jgi:hypothetical protein
MAEWLKAAVLKTVSGATRSGVRIPLPPPDTKKPVVAPEVPVVRVTCGVRKSELLKRLAQRHPQLPAFPGRLLQEQATPT